MDKTLAADNKPIKIVAKREKIKNFAIRREDNKEVLVIQGYQKSAGGSNNSGPSGRRATRFYPDRSWRKVLGKHGLFRLRQKQLSKEQKIVEALKTKAHGQADLIKGLQVP